MAGQSKPSTCGLTLSTKSLCLVTCLTVMGGAAQQRQALGTASYCKDGSAPFLCFPDEPVHISLDNVTLSMSRERHVTGETKADRGKEGVSTWVAAMTWSLTFSGGPVKVCLSWFSSSRRKVLERGLRFSMPDVARTGTCTPIQVSKKQSWHCAKTCVSRVLAAKALLAWGLLLSCLALPGQASCG